MQAANDALQTQVQDLHVQRGDLKDQRLELSGRMAMIEQERQASTAALLRVQGRLLDLEASGPGAAPAVWWRRQSTWGMAGAVFLLAGWGWQDSVVHAAQAESQRLSLALGDELSAHDAERSSWVETSTALVAEAKDQRAANDAQFGVLLTAMEDRGLELERERMASAEARSRSEQRIQGVLEEGAAARQIASERLALAEAARDEDLAAAQGVMARERRAMEVERGRFHVVLDQQAASAKRREEALLLQMQESSRAEESLEARFNRQVEMGRSSTELLDGALARVKALEQRLRLGEARTLLYRTLRGVWRQR